jgi:hypothetical protein
MKQKKKIVSEVKRAKMYSVMADTTPDLSNRDQMSVCVRYVDTNSKVWERLIEITETQDKTGKGNNIFFIINYHYVGIFKKQFYDLEYRL